MIHFTETNIADYADVNLITSSKKVITISITRGNHFEITVSKAKSLTVVARRCLSAADAVALLGTHEVFEMSDDYHNRLIKLEALEAQIAKLKKSL